MFTKITFAVKQVGLVLTCRRGATAIEYGLIVAGIALAIVAAVVTLGGSVNTLFGTIDTGLLALGG